MSVPHSNVDFAHFKLPEIRNEPNFHYAPGSKERAQLQAALAEMRKECPEVPIIIDGKEVFLCFTIFFNKSNYYISKV